MDRSDIRFKIAAARRMLYREGCDSQTAGHVQEQATIRDEVDTNAANDERVASSLGDRSVLLVQNHGAIVVGADIEAATVKGFLLEKAARYHHDCVLLGGTELELENQIRFYKQTLEQYMLREVWDAQLRRLERSDPDLFEVIA